jgi:hypothetical protein
MGIIDGRTYSDCERRHSTVRFERASAGGADQGSAQWRSGMKHDLSRVMEFWDRDGVLENGEGQHVALEEDLVFPLLKGSDVFHGRAPGRKFVLVPQRKIGASTAFIGENLPRTAHYLASFDERFVARKSSIYQGRPPYSVFGIGDYSFAPFKVAVCGLYRQLAFSLVGPHQGKPVIFDDTVYFLPFEEESAARETYEALASPLARDFFEARTFWDAKRPVNKALLQSLDLEKLLASRRQATRLA